MSTVTARAGPATCPGASGVVSISLMSRQFHRDILGWIHIGSEVSFDWCGDLHGRNFLRDTPATRRRYRFDRLRRGFVGLVPGEGELLAPGVLSRHGGAAPLLGPAADTGVLLPSETWSFGGVTSCSGAPVHPARIVMAKRAGPRSAVNPIRL